MHEFVNEFGQGKDKILMMRRLGQFRTFVQKEISTEYTKAISTAKSAIENMY